MHIGQRIKEVLKEKGCSVSWLSKKLCCSRTNIYKVFDKSTIDTGMLSRLSKILEHDFFSDLSDDFFTDVPK